MLCTILTGPNNNQPIGTVQIVEFHGPNPADFLNEQGAKGWGTDPHRWTNLLLQEA